MNTAENSLTGATAVGSMRLLGHPIMKTKLKYKYMHTIDRQPGHFDGGQVCFALMTRPIALCDTLVELRSQQQSSRLYRTSKGWENDATLSYMKVKVS